MPLVNMTEMLTEARNGRYAVGAFNILDYNSMLGVVRAAENAGSPVIIQTSAKTVKLWGAPAMAGWMRQIAGDADVPVALHLDHCKDLDLIRDCIDAGWTSVMIDASSKPFDENLALTQQVLAMAAPVDVSVEAELGEIGGVEDDIAVAEEDAHLADPAKAEEFCREAPVDCFAPAVGTAHGIYKGEPKISFERIENIAERTGIPLALHGGTGLADDVFKKAIRLGCAKVNISTQLKYAFIDSFRDYTDTHKTEYNPLKQITAQADAIEQAVAAKLELFGSVGKAAVAAAG